MKLSEYYYLRQVSLYLVICHVKNRGSYLAITWYTKLLDSYLFEHIKNSQNS